MVRRAPALAAALLALVLAVAGCEKVGAPSAEERVVQGVVLEYMQALAAGDGRAACGMLTPEARAELSQVILGSPGGSCPEAFTQAADDVGQESADSLSAADVGAVFIEGDEAQTVITVGRFSSRITLVRTADGWLVATPPSGG